MESGTKGAPSHRHPRAVTKKSAEFGSHRATRSPGSTPREASPAAVAGPPAPRARRSCRSPSRPSGPGHRVGPRHAGASGQGRPWNRPAEGSPSEEVPTSPTDTRPPSSRSSECQRPLLTYWAAGQRRGRKASSSPIASGSGTHAGRPPAGGTAPGPWSPRGDPISSGARPEGLIEILDDVVDMFDPDGQSNHIGRNSRQAELFCIQLSMGRRGRVADE